MVFDNELLPLRWPLEHFKRIVLSKIKVTRISTGTLNFNDDNVNEFIETLRLWKIVRYSFLTFVLITGLLWKIWNWWENWTLKGPLYYGWKYVKYLITTQIQISQSMSIQKSSFDSQYKILILTFKFFKWLNTVLEFFPWNIEPSHQP